jgi:hypothetical protein
MKRFTMGALPPNRFTMGALPPNRFTMGACPQTPGLKALHE